MISSGDTDERYSHPLVRDLEWLLSAPDLLAMPCGARPNHRELGLNGESQRSLLDDLERDPLALETFMAAARQARLGLYHERLWQFLLSKAPGTQLLAHNLAIRREKRTLGELDMLYRRRSDGGLVHLEVAIKFYLGLTSGPGEPTSQARWIGPGSLDSLAIKRERLQRHQLPLLELDETQAALQALRIEQGWDKGGRAEVRIEQRVALPGVLFYPWQGIAGPDSSASQPRWMAPPDEATLNHLRGTWLAWSQWPNFIDHASTRIRGAQLSKPHWLAPPIKSTLVSLDTLNGTLCKYFKQSERPVPLVLFDAAEPTWQRIFVVGDGWPRQVSLPPWTARSLTR
ncbi:MULTISPECIES: DUF1853 family protein [Halomonadaceae]|uniref:DUF1853 family protein n=1 Tax=Halomonadaceae TaxID=28256 RepID=UPI0015994858|nr:MULTISPECIES: DUF1853 family protein [Halomonas]QJQ94373.1 DUF1853 family protein [Halomonas sp. PA5]